MRRYFSRVKNDYKLAKQDELECKLTELYELNEALKRRSDGGDKLSSSSGSLSNALHVDGDPDEEDNLFRDGDFFFGTVVITMK